METQPVTIRILVAMHKEIGIVAEAEGTTFADVIRTSLNLYLKNRRSNNADITLLAMIQNLSLEVRSQSQKIDVINSTANEIKRKIDDFEAIT